MSRTCISTIRLTSSPPGLPRPFADIMMQREEEQARTGTYTVLGCNDSDKDPGIRAREKRLGKGTKSIKLSWLSCMDDTLPILTVPYNDPRLVLLTNSRSILNGPSPEPLLR
jgi:hypothetical protein